MDPEHSTPEPSGLATRMNAADDMHGQLPQQISGYSSSGFARMLRERELQTRRSDALLAAAAAASAAELHTAQNNDNNTTAGNVSYTV